MKRRSFLALLGLAPAAANVVPKIADAPGADGGELSKVQEELRKMKAEIGPLAVQAIQRAKKRGVKGL